ncbi:MAG: ABC transporter ATP-binding protein [Lachnospiraceae bacterium]|nr:ABC transporter ATP-binding protein [Lachnospiraceae bacterium]
MSKAGTEYVRGMPVVKVFQQTVYSFKNFRDAIEEYSEKAEHVQDRICKIPQSINLTAIEGAFVFMVPVVLFMAPRALSEGTFASFVADFAFYAVFSAIISTALARIMFAANGAMLADTAMKRIETVMNAPVLLQPEEAHIPSGNDIEFRNVSFTYEGSEVPALSDLSFKIRSGETVALVGPSGSGKSTCARLAARLWDIDKGSIKMGGVDIASVEPETLLSDYSFVFQDVMLFDDTVMENIRLGKHGATDEEVMNAARAANCDEFVQKLPKGYDTKIGENGTKLSGGERQRISIARALLKDAPIVLLDEATASLDVENETRVQGALSRLLRNRTVLIIAHRMRTVERADKVVVLKEGRVAEEGNPEELKKNRNSIFGHMLELQTQGAQWSI